MGKATPTARQRHLVALWHGSTLTKAAFARSHGVRPKTFASWVERHAPTPTMPARSSAFVQVMATPLVAVPAAFVVRVDEHMLRFDAPPPPAWFAEVLRELARC